MAGPLRSTDVTPLHRYCGPNVILSSSADFPVSPVIRRPGSGDFSPGRGGLLQLLGMSLSPCCRFHPAEVTSRIGQCSVSHSAFAPTLKARPRRRSLFHASGSTSIERQASTVSRPDPGRPPRSETAHHSCPPFFSEIIWKLGIAIPIAVRAARASALRPACHAGQQRETQPGMAGAFQAVR